VSLLPVGAAAASVARDAFARLSQLEADSMAKCLILHGTKPKVFTTRQLRR